jgi:hypothetical protein
VALFTVLPALNSTLSLQVNYVIGQCYKDANNIHWWGWIWCEMKYRKNGVKITFFWG